MAGAEKLDSRNPAKEKVRFRDAGCCAAHLLTAEPKEVLERAALARRHLSIQLSRQALQKRRGVQVLILQTPSPESKACQRTAWPRHLQDR